MLNKIALFKHFFNALADKALYQTKKIIKGIIQL